VPAGRARVEVRADGYLDNVREVVAAGDGLPMPFKLAERQARQLVFALGGTYTFRGSTLAVPPGAFASDTPVSLTYLTRGRLAALLSSPQFIDEKGVPRRAMALVDLMTDPPPAKPLRVRVPVPADATAATVSGFQISAGRWTAPVALDMVAGGFAELTLAGPAQIGIAVDVRGADGRRPGYVIAEGGYAYREGDVLLAGEQIVPGTRPCAFVDPRGTRFELAPETDVRLGVIGPEAPSSPAAPYASRIELVAGQARVLLAAPAAPLVAMTVAGHSATFAAGSGAFSIAACGTTLDPIDLVEVVEGKVTAATDTERQEVAAGETATVCAGCGGATCLPVRDGGAPADAAAADAPPGGS
jgi:hypothetical protein